MPLDTDSRIPVLVPGEPLQSPAARQPEIDAAAQKLYHDVHPSIVKIQTDKGSGSGFYIDDKGTVATDAHVVLGSVEQFSVDDHGKMVRLELAKLDDLRDLAILRPVRPQQSKPLELGRSSALRQNDPVFAVSHPLGDAATYISPGTYRGIFSPLQFIGLVKPKEAAEFDKELRDLNDHDLTVACKHPLLDLALHIEHGSSGGPAIDGFGRVVGLCNLSSDDKNGYFTPVEDLDRLRTGPDKFKFSYADLSEDWTQRYMGAWNAAPLAAAGSTVFVGGLGVGALALTNKFSPRRGGAIAALGGGLMLYEDAHAFLNRSESMDKLKYGLASTADLSTVIGGVALLAARKKTFGLSAIAVGVLGRVATDFIPNRHVLTNIVRTDGSKEPPFSFEAEAAKEREKQK